MKFNLPAGFRAFLFSVLSLLVLPALSPKLRADPVTTVTVEGNSYDVSFLLLDSFNSQLSLFESQVWWGNAALAGEFSAAVGDSLGNGNFGNQAPYFAYTLSPLSSGPNWLGAYTYDPGYSTVGTFEAPISNWAGRWAYVVPQASVDDSSSSFALILVGLTALGFAKRRLQRAAA